jgi:hypothetical protein
MDIDEHTSNEYREPKRPQPLDDRDEYPWDSEAANISHSLHRSLDEANEHHDALRASYIADAINNYDYDRT